MNNACPLHPPPPPEKKKKATNALAKDLRFFLISIQ